MEYPKLPNLKLAVLGCWCRHRRCEDEQGQTCEGLRLLRQLRDVRQVPDRILQERRTRQSRDGGRGTMGRPERPRARWPWLRTRAAGRGHRVGRGMTWSWSNPAVETSVIFCRSTWFSCLARAMRNLQVQGAPGSERAGSTAALEGQGYGALGLQRGRCFLKNSPSQAECEERCWVNGESG